MKPQTGQNICKNADADEIAVLKQATVAPEVVELAELQDRYLRLAAEFDNFRKRTAQETERRATAQKDSFIRDLLPVLDNLERATSSEGSAEQLRQGIQMTIQQWFQLLTQHGIELEHSLGQPFDPLRHEAVGTRSVPSQSDHAILEVFQRGYRRGQESFRPAKVVVNDLSHTDSMRHAG
jgi:molecular chaperone GrpE